MARQIVALEIDLDFCCSANSLQNSSHALGDAQQLELRASAARATTPERQRRSPRPAAAASPRRRSSPSAEDPRARSRAARAAVRCRRGALAQSGLAPAPARRSAAGSRSTAPRAARSARVMSRAMRPRRPSCRRVRRAGEIVTRYVDRSAAFVDPIGFDSGSTRSPASQFLENPALLVEQVGRNEQAAGRPIASASVYPKMRCAAAFQLRITPSRSVDRIASSDDSTIAASRSRASIAACSRMSCSRSALARSRSLITAASVRPETASTRKEDVEQHRVDERRIRRERSRAEAVSSVAIVAIRKHRQRAPADAEIDGPPHHERQHGKRQYVQRTEPAADRRK